MRKMLPAHGAASGYRGAERENDAFQTECRWRTNGKG